MKWQLNTAQFKIDQGQRAFIYQQLSEFDPYLLSDSTVSVEINSHSNHSEPNSEVSITITLVNDGTQVSATSTEPDVISATTKAKEKLLEFLYQVQQEVLNLETTGS